MKSKSLVAMLAFLVLVSARMMRLGNQVEKRSASRSRQRLSLCSRPLRLSTKVFFAMRGSMSN
jgi:hypothetical protein